MSTVSPAGTSISRVGVAATLFSSTGSPFVMPSPKNVTCTSDRVSPGLCTTSCSSTDGPVRPDVNHHCPSARGVPAVVEYPRRPAPR